MTRRSPHNFARIARASRAGGFTLLELVLVLIVLAAISALAVPQLRGFLTSSTSRDAATQVVSIAQYARSKAASEAVVYRLSFDETVGEYWLSADDATGNGSFVSLGNDFGQVFTLPSGMRITVERLGDALALSSSATATDLDFRPDGTSDAVLIRLTDRDGFETLIAAPAPTEPLRVVTTEEAAAL